MGVIGVGGLGTSALRLAKLVGASTTAISRSASKEAGCRQDGVDEFLLSTSAEQMKQSAGQFDLLIDTTPVNTEVGQWLDLLRFGGTYCRVGLPKNDNSEFKYNFIPLIFEAKKIVGKA